MPGLLGSLPGHQVSILPNPNSKKVPLFSLLQVEKHHIPVQDPALWLTNSPKTFSRVTKPISLHCQKQSVTLFLYLDIAVILVESYMQARLDWQGVASLLHRLGFALSHNKCQLEPTHVFTYLGLTLDTRKMTISLLGKKVQAIKTSSC